MKNMTYGVIVFYSYEVIQTSNDDESCECRKSVLLVKS